MTQILHVNLLGPPEVYWGREPVAISRRHPKALLFYLAYRKGLVSRDALLTLLWPRTEISSARLRLNETLSRLRASLPDPKLIIRHGDLVGMDDSRIQVDARVFDQIVAQVGSLPWRIPNGQPLPFRFVQKLDEALDLWSGSQFILGDVLPSTPELDSWLTQTGSHYEYRRLTILERLSRHYYIIGDYHKAQDMAWDGIDMDRANLDLHLIVIQCLVNQGHLREARKHYLVFQEHMRAEPNFDGSPEMDALFAQLDPASNGKSTTMPEWKLHPSINVPFVGRQDVLDQLQQCYSQHRNVGILGESGSGKTRLIQEFTRQIQPPPRVMVAVCRPYETSLPFQPISEVLRRNITPEEWLGLPPIWASHLLRLLPELSILRPELETPTIPLNPVQAQATLLEAIRQVFLSINQDQPLVLVIDDTHWADEATLSTLIYLQSRPPFHQQAFLIALARQEELSPYLEEMAVSMGNNPQTVTLRLPGLSAPDITDLARFILKEEPSVDLVQNLLKGTGGNALFVLEVLREMLDLGLETFKGTDFHIPLSENLLNLIKARILKLDSVPRAILEIAAILGPQFDLSMLIRVSLKSGPTVVMALEYLEKRLILNPVTIPDDPARYQFVHDKFREVLVTSITPAKAAIIHERVADLMVETYQPDQAAILAHHKQAAGKLLDAFRYWIEAGNYARSLLSKEEANNAFIRAENLIPKIDTELSVDDLYTLFSPWCEMVTETHQIKQASRLGNQLLTFGEKLQSPLLVGTALDTLSDVAMMENRFADGLDYASRAIPFLERSGNVFEQMEAQIHQGVFLYMQNQINDAILAFQSALALGSDQDAPELDPARGNAHYQLSLLHTLKGWPKQGIYHGERSLSAAERCNRTYSKVAAYFVLTLSSYYLADFHQAWKFAQTGIALAERAQGWRMLGYLNSYAAAVDLTLGYVDSALIKALKTIQLGENTGLSDVIAMGCRHAGDVYNRLGAPAIGIQYYARGVETGGEHFTGIDNLIRLGYVQCVSGQMETGLQTLTNALAASREIDLGLGIIMVEFFQSMAYAFVGEWDQAGRLAQKVRDAAHHQNLPTYYFDAILTMGRLAVHDGDFDKAGNHFRLAADEARLVSNIWLELYALALLDQLNQRIKVSDPELGNRINQLLTLMDSNTQSEALREIFLAYRSSISPS